MNIEISTYRLPPSASLNENIAGILLSGERDD